MAQKTRTDNRAKTKNREVVETTVFGNRRDPMVLVEKIGKLIECSKKC